MSDHLMPKEAELQQAYIEWWTASYGTKPNSQATIVAAAWARYALEVFCVQFHD